MHGWCDDLNNHNMASVNAITLRLYHVVKSPFISKSLSSSILQNLRICKNSFHLQNARVYSKNADSEATNSFEKPKEIRKKTVPIPKIMLLSQEGKVLEQLTLDQAQNLAKRRNLNLVQVVDVSLKSTSPTYQLMSRVQLLQEQNTAKLQKVFEKNTLVKATKDFVISNKIDNHDLEIKINKMAKLLKKHHKVRIYVSLGGKKEMMDSIVKTIETGIGNNGQLIKKVASGSGVKLYFDPIIPIETNIEEAPL